MPTAVLSTHTTFKNFTCKDLTDQLRPIAEHWRSEHLHFDAVYTGYIASREQVQQVCDFYDWHPQRRYHPLRRPGHG